MSSFIFDFSFIFPPFHPIRLSIQPLHSSYAKPHPPPFHCRQPIGSSAASWNVCRHASVCMRAGKKLLLWRFIGSWNSVDVPLVGRGVRCIPPPRQLRSLCVRWSYAQSNRHSHRKPNTGKRSLFHLRLAGLQLSDMIPALLFCSFLLEIPGFSSFLSKTITKLHLSGTNSLYLLIRRT